MVQEQSSSALYPQLLEDAWLELDKGVRRLHINTDGENVQAVGTFRVQHGKGWLARLLVLPMPPASEAVTTRLTVTRRGRGELWSRMFGRRPLVSTQTAGPDRLLIERMGFLELRFRLEASNGALHYKCTHAALCVGPLRISLPRWLSPQISGHEESGNSPQGTLVSVSVTAPFAGFLLSYEGNMEAERPR